MNDVVLQATPLEVLSTGRLQTNYISGTGSVTVASAQGLVLHGDPCNAVAGTVSLSGMAAIVVDIDGSSPSEGSMGAGTIVTGVVNDAWSSLYLRFGDSITVTCDIIDHGDCGPKNSFTCQVRSPCCRGVVAVAVTGQCISLCLHSHGLMLPMDGCLW